MVERVERIRLERWGGGCGLGGDLVGFVVVVTVLVFFE